MAEKGFANAQIEKRVNSLIDKAFKDTFDRYTIIVSPESGDNFMGFMYNITVDGYREEKNTKLKLIVKLAPQQEYFRKVFPIRGMYCTEVYVYSNIFPVFVNIQKERKLSNIFHSFPIHYISSIDFNEETVVMEDMKEKDFKIGNYHVPVDYPHASVVLKTLARFHALSFAVKDQKPEVFKKWGNECKDCFFGTPVKVPVIKGIQNLGVVVRDAYNVTEHKREKEAFGKFVETLPDVFTSILDVDKAEGYEVVNHGDTQMRNLLFKYGDASKPNVPTDVCLIDWQITRLGSPAIDVIFFLLLSTDKELRRNYYKQLIEDYYQSLSSFIRELGSDPEILFPYEVFLKHLKKFAAFGLYCAVWVVGLNMKDGEVPDFQGSVDEETLVKLISASPSKAFIARIHDLVADLMEYDYDF